jgi:hypothetical protein
MYGKGLRILDATNLTGLFQYGRLRKWNKSGYQTYRDWLALGGSAGAAWTGFNGGQWCGVHSLFYTPVVMNV